MKTSDIGSILNAFFCGQNYRAILIDGKWGIGKTYQFKKYFDSLKKKDKKRVFYFTIFGAENMDELNTKIYRKLHPKWSKFLIGYKTISQSVDAVVGLKNSSLNISPNLDYVLDLVKPEKVRKNPILIFDDIERFSNEHFSLFLGLLYKLNLQGARIICLTSSEKLNEKDLRLYGGSSRKWKKKRVMPIVNACAAMVRPLEEDGYFGLNPKDDLCDRITALLRDKPKGLPCWKIASLLCVDKKAIRPILCGNTDRFSKNSIFWRLK